MNEIILFATAMTPIGELRAAIPIGIEVLHMNPWRVFIVAILGNAMPVLVLVYTLEIINKWSEENFVWLHRVLTKVYARTERVFKGKYEKHGALALFFFTLVPLPVTGVWTASVAAVFFRIRPKIAVPAILLGMFCAGILVTFATLGVESIISLFL